MGCSERRPMDNDANELSLWKAATDNTWYWQCPYCHTFGDRRFNGRDSLNAIANDYALHLGVCTER